MSDSDRRVRGVDPGREGINPAKRTMTRVSRRESMTRRSEFVRVREGGKSAGGRYLVLATLEEAGLEGLRFGFVTSKRVGNAVVRNRVRRRLRALVREHGAVLSGGRYLVMIARHRAGEASLRELAEDWMKLVDRLGLREKAS